ncbi:amino acid adenylation domain-containing protein [Kitasatospora sp. NPDC057518]|uniref:amino acid adenylation domain-containing protein n=1 Tax=Kitasatospora sp. NPDC057518 TaxID=3346155 RepID=UPI0036ACCA1A
MLPALVRAHARTHPHRTAVVVGRERLTYARLASRADRLTDLLRASGIGRGCLVGIHLDRTADAVVAQLAVLGAGAAFTLVEPTEPVAEGANRLALAAPDLVLAEPRHHGELRRSGLRVADGHEAGGGLVPPPAPADGPTEPGPADDDTAYVLYTSGSTGVPKGVQVSHANIRHYTESLLQRLDITEPLSYAHVTTLAADLGNTCLFLPLWTGGTLHLVDDATRRDPAALLRYLQDHRVDVLKTTPSHWSVVFRAFGQDGTTRPELRFLLLGGELLALPLARRILDSGVTRNLVNHYGPTEATVGVAAHRLTAASDLDALDGASVPIGTALGRTRLLVRADDGTFHDRDAVGELYIAGPSVALGYRDDPQATAAAFTDDLARLDPALGRAYRTGDRVRADSRGVLEFLGRGDRQVKVSGYRIELGHVEAGLRRHPAVADAVAVLLTRDRAMLVAAVVPAADGRPAIQPAVLRRELRELLPAHMVPDRIEAFDAFPRNANGKTDQAALRELLEARLAERTPRPSDPAADGGDPVLADVLASWQRHLGHGDFAVDQDFDQAGGSSIDAIQVIADLQAKGYRVSAAAFLAEPTAAALATRLREDRGGDDHGRASAARVVADDRALSPAQTWFFRQEFAQPDQWNQALLLETDSTPRPAELAAAVADVVGLHPMLRTAFRPGADGRRRELVDPADAFSWSRLPEEDGPAARTVRDVAAALQREIRIADGNLFKVHLFLGDGRAELLLICHHLAIDAVSWRIVVSDLSRCYSERLRGGEPTTAPGPTGFGQWATHLRDRAAQLRGDLAHFDSLARLPAVAPRPDAPGDNREGDAQALWFRLSRAQSAALTEAAARSGIPAHAALLGAFAQALTEQLGTDELVADVESHGRICFDETLEVSRVVGWFTSTFPVSVRTVAGDLAATGKSAAAALAEVPALGVAYGLHEQPQRADVCFNYLGPFALPFGDDLHLRPSRHRVGPVRGPENDRGYGLKLTARVHDGQLVADLSYTPARHDPERMLDLARATRDHLLRGAGLPPADGRFVLESGSSTGLLAQVPGALECEPPAGSVREYGTVLLTGATGFIGAHLLDLLLTRTRSKVVCLVRAKEGRTPAERLADAYAWYVPDGRLDAYADRLTVLAGDLAEPDFGLAEPDYRRLCHEAEALYHLAADTRLFGDRESFDRQNTEPVRAMIRLATTGRPKDLHYVSTLAVCGGGAPGEPAVFSEDSLDIGQEFLNEYERSKYDAERLVQGFATQGGSAFVYRSGNVSGHSVSGRFQRNGGDNRLVQLLRASVRIGRVPRVGALTLALSPVDVVARGILEISRSARVRGGTFHLDTHHEVSYERLFTVLRDQGYALAEDGAEGFAELFGRYLGDGGEQLSLAHFWAGRPDRNVRYDHTRTRRLLARLGVEFPEVTGSWLHAFFTGLGQQGELPSAGTR